MGSLVVLCAGSIVPAAAAAPARPAPPPRGAQPESDPARLLATLRDAAADPATRDAAADGLVQLSHRSEAAGLVTLLLHEDGDADRVRSITLGAIARAWDPPPRLFRPLVEILERATKPNPEALAALGSYRTREAAAVLIRYLPRDRSAAEREAAGAALTRMTGRDDLWADPAAAAAWIEQAQTLSVREWQDLLAQGVWRRMQRLEADQRAAAERLTDGYRRLYLALPATPGEERARLLSQMLLGSRPELRSLGIEIVSREVSAGKAVDPSIAEAAIKLLESPEPAVRSAAGALLIQIGPPNGGEPLLRALVAETDAAAAAALLRAMVRWPSAAGVEPALRWMRSSPGTFPAAAEAVFALHSAGLLTEQSDRAAALVALRAVEATRLTSPGCRLLAALGTAEDRDRVAQLLEGDSASLRSAAAAALADRPEYLDRILAAAATEAPLYNIAVRAVSECQPTAEGLERLRALPALTPDDHRLGLLRASAMLGAEDLLAAARRADADAPLREAMLARLAQYGPGPARAAAENTGAITEGLILLAETRLAMKRPDLAVAALDVVPPPSEGADSTRLVRLRAVALIWANQLDRAAELGAPAEVWIEGLEYAIAEPHARAVLREIEARFGPALTPEQRERVRAISDKIRLTDSGPVDDRELPSDPGSPREGGK